MSNLLLMMLSFLPLADGVCYMALRRPAAGAQDRDSKTRAASIQTGWETNGAPLRLIAAQPGESSQK